MQQLKIIVVLGACFLAIAACGAPPSNNSTAINTYVAPTPATAPDNSSADTAGINGKELYALNCMICHRNTGKGGPTTIQGKKIKPDNLTEAHMKSWPDEKWFKVIQEGRPDDGMPAFKDKLKPEEIKAIVDYVKTLS